jgi:hypothetical protein
LFLSGMFSSPGIFGIGVIVIAVMLYVTSPFLAWRAVMSIP